MIKKKFIYLVITLILVIGVISAESSISQTSFVIKIYNNTISVISNEYSGNNQIFNFSIINSTKIIDNSTNITSYYVPYTEFNYTFLFGTRNISVDMGLVEKCLNDTNTWMQCKLDAAANFTNQALVISSKDNDINNKQTQIDTLTKEKTDTQNQKWLFFLAGGGIAIFIIFLLQGKIGKKVRDKSMNEFNLNQAR